MAWWRRSKQQEVDLRVPMQHVLELRERIEVLETTQLRIDNQFRQLRGYVYAKKGIVGPPDTGPEGEVARSAAAPSASSSKDELRRRLVAEGRMVPGKPPVHQE